MKALKCEMCGSNDVVKQDGLYVCQNCGTKYTVEEARKMMIEGTVEVQGTVIIDSSSELQNLYKLARMAKIENNTENAEKYYDQILLKDPNSWEAAYYMIYYKAMNCRLGEIKRFAISVTNALPRVMNLVKSEIVDSDEQKSIVEEVYSRNKHIANTFFNVATNHYNDLPESLKYDGEEEYIREVIEIQEIMYYYGVIVEKLFKENSISVAIESWESGININKEIIKYLTPEARNQQMEIIMSFAKKIQEYEPTYVMPEIDYKRNDSGCYIATAVYGSYNCPEVWTLRRFRDNTLDGTWYGRAFIKTYYAISPTLVRWFGETSWFKDFWRKPLDKLVASLRNKGVEDTPYIDKY